MAKISYFPLTLWRREEEGELHLKRGKRSTEDWGRKADIGEDMRKKKQRRKAKTWTLKEGVAFVSRPLHRHYVMFSDVYIMKLHLETWKWRNQTGFQ